MANQIGKFFESQRHSDPASGIAEHLAHFWDPRMRDKIIKHVALGGAGLDPAVKDAVRLLHPVDSQELGRPAAASR
jgi:formate dehydrogenase subunit delta